jgi:hypothetical protein
MVAQMVSVRPELSVVEPTGAGKGKLRFVLHRGQTKAWDSQKRFILILAGLQSGKTSFYPPWLWREMKMKGPGDYLVASPTFTLLELKALPEFKRFFVTHMKAGEYKASPIREFTLNRRGEIMLWGESQETPTRVLFGHAQDPDSLESGTYKAAVLDEAGQKKFRRDSWVSIQGRLSIHQGRVLFPTTPYTLGWLKSEIYDPWVKSDQNHPEIDVINFESIENPVFPVDEFERMRKQLPRWLFNMRYRGRFERPAGLIYDCWDDDLNIIPKFTIPESWPRFAGMDFGGVNTAAIMTAQELGPNGKPTGRYIGYREYLAGGRTARQHKEVLLSGPPPEPRIPTVIGGSKSEGQWRQEFASAGLPIMPPPVSEVEVGILRMYGAIATRSFVVMDSLVGFIDQIRSYSRELDADGQPTEKIEDKETYHYLDCGRYLWARLESGMSGRLVSFAGDDE